MDEPDDPAFRAIVDIIEETRCNRVNPRPVQDPIDVAGHQVIEHHYGQGCYAWRIKQLPDGYWLTAERQLVNWRLSEVDDEGWPRRGWCYEGTGFLVLLKVLVAGLDWDWSPDTRPEGWVRDVVEQEHRRPADWPPDWFDKAVDRLYAAAPKTATDGER